MKRVRGGLVEVEFIVQTLQLLHAPSHPDVLDANTFEAVEKLAAAGILPRAEESLLRQASLLYQRVTQVLRLCVSGPYDPAASPSGLNRIIASASETPDIATAESLLAETQARVALLFDKKIGEAG